MHTHKTLRSPPPFLSRTYYKQRKRTAGRVPDLPIFFSLSRTPSIVLLSNCVAVPVAARRHHQINAKHSVAEAAATSIAPKPLCRVLLAEHKAHCTKRVVLGQQFLGDAQIHNPAAPGADLPSLLKQAGCDFGEGRTHFLGSAVVFHPGNAAKSGAKPPIYLPSEGRLS